MSDMIVEQAYWDDTYRSIQLRRIPKNDATRNLLWRLVPQATAGATAFEFGCFPGRYLAELGELGYKLSGCDQTPRVETDLLPWMTREGLEVEEIYKCDYREVPNKKYDVVASFGFVEHFENYLDIFRYHFQFVKPGGLVVVTFPNFRGVVQRTLRGIFDRENLDRHVIASMNISKYRAIAESFGSIEFCDHYGNFDLWVEPSSIPHGKLRKKALATVMRSRRVWRHLPSLPAWAPFAGIAVRTPKI